MSPRFPDTSVLRQCASIARNVLERERRDRMPVALRDMARTKVSRRSTELLLVSTPNFPRGPVLGVLTDDSHELGGGRAMKRCEGVRVLFLTSSSVGFFWERRFVTEAAPTIGLSKARIVVLECIMLEARLKPVRVF